jgi:hypothetical protein
LKDGEQGVTSTWHTSEGLVDESSGASLPVFAQGPGEGSPVALVVRLAGERVRVEKVKVHGKLCRVEKYMLMSRNSAIIMRRISVSENTHALRLAKHFAGQRLLVGCALRFASLIKNEAAG